MIASFARLLAAGICLIAAGAAQAQPYPSQPIKVVVAAGPASGIDLTIRAMAEELRRILGQPITVENKPGANGLIGIQEVLRARPDGYTLLGGNINTNTLMPVIQSRKLDFDINTRLIPITYLNYVPAVLIASRSLPETFAGFIDHARKNPGKLNYGVTAIGAYNHLDMLALSKVAGITMEPVVVPTVAAAATSLLNGDAPIIFLTSSAAVPLLQDGKTRALAVTSPKRLAELPDTPTMAELGYTGVGSSVWQGLFAPAGTPREVIDRLFQAARQALGEKSVNDAFAKMMFVAQPSESPAAFAAWLKQDYDKWLKVAQEHDLIEK